MSKHDLLYEYSRSLPRHAGSASLGRAIWAGAFASILTFALPDGAHAAPDCLARPGQQSGPGTHWYYYIDRATRRRCWYLKQVETTRTTEETTPANAGTTRSAEPTAPANTEEQSPGMAWLSQAFSALTGSSTQEPEQTAPEPSTQAAPKPPRKRRTARRSDRPSAPARHSSPKPSSAAATAPASELDATAREALFREFLQWRTRKILTE